MTKQYTFKAGKTYLAFDGYSRTPWRFRCIRRTAKTVWLESEDGEHHGYRIQNLTPDDGLIEAADDGYFKISAFDVA